MLVTVTWHILQRQEILCPAANKRGLFLLHPTIFLLLPLVLSFLLRALLTGIFVESRAWKTHWRSPGGDGHRCIVFHTAHTLNVPMREPSIDPTLSCTALSLSCQYSILALLVPLQWGGA